MNHVINSNGTFKVKEFSTQKSKKYEISLDNHSIIIGDYSKIIRRLFKYETRLGGSPPFLKKMDPRVIIYSKNVGKDPRSDSR